MGQVAGGALGPAGDVLTVPPDGHGVRRLSPTDVSQFVRLEQCRRYLRLRLHERAVGRDFLSDLGVTAQAIPPLLTRSGVEYERRIETAVARRYPVWDFGGEGKASKTRTDDNAELVEAAVDLPPGASIVLLQPRLRVQLDGWLVVGDVDLLRLERDREGTLRALVADVKSSNSAKVEHRLQVAFYQAMLAALFAESGVACAEIALSILYRGPLSDPEPADAADVARLAAERAAALDHFGVDEGYLEIVADPDAYAGAVHDLVTGPTSVARTAAEAPFEAIPFHLTYKCDGCLYNEFCMKRSVEGDDLSLLPHLAEQEKAALRRAGIETTRDLAALKVLRQPGAGGATPGPTEADDPPELGRSRRSWDLVPAPGREADVRALAGTWRLGPRLDTLVHRAHRYRKYLGEPVEAPPWIPGTGYSSLPYTDAEHDPNLVRVYLDAQHDHLTDRVYLLGALVVGCEGGREVPTRRRSVVRMADGAPDAAAEAALFLRWVWDTLRAINDVAAPDAAGQPRAPIHLIFARDVEQRRLLDGLARHAGEVLGATPLYDFVTQLAGFDSSLVSYLDQEVRDHKNLPIVCQSLYSVSAHLGFQWNQPEPFRRVFRERIFDSQGRLDGTAGSVAPDDGAVWYTRRARFDSQLPLEYAYASWGDLGPPRHGAKDDLAPYREVTRDQLVAFEARRLEAIEHIARQFKGNRDTSKTPFLLPDLATFDGRARSLAGALDEFLTIERHVALQAWKRLRLAAPERRVLAGQTLIVRYHEADQDPEVVERNRDNLERQAQRDAFYAETAAGPDGKVKLSKEDRDATRWSQEGMAVRLRLDVSGVDCGLEETVALSTLRPGDSLILFPRTTVDRRLPREEQVPKMPTAKQLLHGARAWLTRISVETDPSGARVAFAEVRLGRENGHTDSRGYTFGPTFTAPLHAEECYTLDEDPNDYYGFWQAKVVDGLTAGGALNAVYARLTGAAPGRADWPAVAAAGQSQFLAGLDALKAAGAAPGFEPGKRAFIGGHGETPTLLVQGPPGTGKSYTTAFAVLARLQGAMAAGRDLRVVVGCKTHAATDVLLAKIADVQADLRRQKAAHPAIWAAHFDDRLLDVPLYRLRPRGEPPAGTRPLVFRDDPETDGRKVVEVLRGHAHVVVGATPGGVYKAVKEGWTRGLHGHHLVDCVVLDEASQMGLPEAVMAALLLRPDGQLVVVGDHRQMPPIVQHAWEDEPRRTFQEYQAFASLFEALQGIKAPTIRFAESFRLHADLAEVLRREIYRHDGIAYHSRRRDLLPPVEAADPFVAATLTPEHPLVVVVHGEASSQQRNPFEQDLIVPLLDAMSGGLGLDPKDGMGVVVPHRAQRAALQAALPHLTVLDPLTGEPGRSAVDTVERFQGGERDAIVVGATESDPGYLLLAGDFLLDPRRLTVALSRAKRKMVVVAARSVFSLFSADETTFAHAQMWKNLLRRTCTVPLWSGERDGVPVEVWGNDPALTPPAPPVPAEPPASAERPAVLAR